MKYTRLLALLICACLSLVSCVPTSTPATSSSASSQSPTMPATPSPTATPSSSRPLRVAFLYFGKIADSGWTAAHELGRQALQKDLPGVQTEYREDVPSGVGALPILRELAKSGADVIVSTSLSFADATLKVAEENPQVRFLQCDGSQSLANLFTYFGWIEEPFYLAGLVAAKASHSGKLGFVAAFPISEVIRNINAFALGALAVNEQATIQVAWSQSWDDRAIERQQAAMLIDAGCDVLAQWQDNAEPLLVAQERGALGIGIHSDMSAEAPKAVLTSVIWNWGVYYTQAIRTIQQSGIPEAAYREGMGMGLVALAPFATSVPQDTRNLVQKYAASFRAQGFAGIYSGPLSDQSGEVRVKEGKTMSLPELVNMDWFVKGIVGDIPSD
jgi:basic membrane protein A